MVARALNRRFGLQPQAMRVPTHPLRCYLAVALLSAGCADEGVVSLSLAERTAVEAQNVDAATLVVERGFGQAQASIIDQLVRDDLVQHSMHLADGKAGLLADVAERGEVPVQVHRVLAEGSLVALHSTYGDGGDQVVAFDVFRFDEGLVAEHWSGAQPWVPIGETVSGRSMVDGVVEVVDHSQEADNEQLVLDFVRQVFTLGRFDLLGEYIGDTYSQHNPLAGDGIEGIAGFGAALAAAGNQIGVTDSPLVVAEGNFVLVGSEGFFGPDENAYQIFFDLFRVESGQLVEHWDVFPPMPAELSSIPHDNGLF